jgi:hypothetical protein
MDSNTGLSLRRHTTALVGMARQPRSCLIGQLEEKYDTNADHLLSRL